MNTATAVSTAATALAAKLPLPGAVTPMPCAGSEVPAERAAQAVAVSFVGTSSADLAVVLVDAHPLAAAAGTDSPLVSAADVLMPALEASAESLGDGVLGDPAVQDALPLFRDGESSVFRLVDASGTVGWFAVRLRGSSSVPSRRAAHTNGAGNLGRISNVEMAMTVEIGRARMSVRDVLDLEPGAVIELDRSAGAPADVLLNGRLVAHGEVVVVDQDYAVRITQIFDVTEGSH